MSINWSNWFNCNLNSESSRFHIHGKRFFTFPLYRKWSEIFDYRSITRTGSIKRPTENVTPPSTTIGVTPTSRFVSPLWACELLIPAFFLSTKLALLHWRLLQVAWSDLTQQACTLTPTNPKQSHLWTLDKPLIGRTWMPFCKRIIMAIKSWGHSTWNRHESFIRWRKTRVIEPLKANPLTHISEKITYRRLLFVIINDRIPSCMPQESINQCLGSILDETSWCMICLGVPLTRSLQYTRLKTST